MDFQESKTEILKESESVMDALNSTKQNAKVRSRKPTADIEWPFKITVDLSTTWRKPKVAFWTGQERRYFPEDLGHSKLSSLYGAMTHAENTPICTYTLPPLGVNKPISVLGYGIGGLLGQRFPKYSEYERRPGPTTYEVSHKYLERPSPRDVNNPILKRQRKIAFEMNLMAPRLAVLSTLKIPGPGSYNVGSTNCYKLKYQDAFASQRCVSSTTTMICSPLFETCQECGQHQKYDYYRTKLRTTSTKTNPRSKLDFVVLCRQCYCQAWNDNSPNWTRKDLSKFQKCRHCSFAHDHRNIRFAVFKTSIRDIQKLSRRESVLAKHFSDQCS